MLQILCKCSNIFGECTYRYERKHTEVPSLREIWSVMESSGNVAACLWGGMGSPQSATETAHGFKMVKIRNSQFLNETIPLLLDICSSEVSFTLKVMSTAFLLVCVERLKGSASKTWKSSLFQFESSFRSRVNQILTFQILKCHDVIKCPSIKHERHITE